MKECRGCGGFSRFLRIISIQRLALIPRIDCGPPIMIKFALCGRRNVGPKYACVDGPVFSLAELRDLPDEL